MSVVVRLGEISFLNTLPLLLPDTLEGVVLEKFRQPPGLLNKAILDGQLDISPVSSAFYLRHQKHLVLLEEVAIAAENPVESVLMFLPKGFKGLTPLSTIAIPIESETSVALMQYLLSQECGFTPQGDQFLPYSKGMAKPYILQGLPTLVFGDEALTLALELSDEPFLRVDLAAYWQRKTGMPFVFAVWVAREAWATKHPDLLSVVNTALIEQKAQFLNDMARQDIVVQEARHRYPDLTPPFILHYLTHALSYNLDMEHLMALMTFESILKWLDNDNERHANRHRAGLPVELLHR